jgi:hypothetical protein
METQDLNAVQKVETLERALEVEFYFGNVNRVNSPLNSYSFQGRPSYISNHEMGFPFPSEAPFFAL